MKIRATLRPINDIEILSTSLSDFVSRSFITLTCQEGSSEEVDPLDDVVAKKSSDAGHIRH